MMERKMSLFTFTQEIFKFLYGDIYINFHYIEILTIKWFNYFIQQIKHIRRNLAHWYVLRNAIVESFYNVAFKTLIPKYNKIA